MEGLTPDAPRARRGRILPFALAAAVTLPLLGALGALAWFAPATAWVDDDPFAAAAELGEEEPFGPLGLTYTHGAVRPSGSTHEVEVPVTIHNRSERPRLVTRASFDAPGFRVAEPDEELRTQLLAPGERVTWQLGFTRYLGPPPEGITVRYGGDGRRVPLALER